jgi:hypothetical protein
LISSGAGVLKPYKDKTWLDEQINVLGKSQRQIAVECNCSVGTINRWLNYDYTFEKEQKYRAENHKSIIEYQRKYNENLRKRLFDILGHECSFCGETNKKYLTFDHINNDSKYDRKTYGENYIYGMLQHWNKTTWPEEMEIKRKLQVLDYNCNCGVKRRKYFNLPKSEMSSSQKRQINLWEKAYDFFGPCRICGDQNLIHLCIGHVKHNGAEMRRKGEKDSTKLLSQWDQMEWPEKLKEIYSLECFNCNCNNFSESEGKII